MILLPDLRIDVLLGELFRKFDTHRDMTLSRRELSSFLLETFSISLTPEQCDSLIDLFDKDGDRQLKWNEYIMLMQSLGVAERLSEEAKKIKLPPPPPELHPPKAITPEEYWKIGSGRAECLVRFVTADTDGNGMLTPDEVELLLTDIHNEFPTKFPAEFDVRKFMSYVTHGSTKKLTLNQVVPLFERCHEIYRDFLRKQ